MKGVVILDESYLNYPSDILNSDYAEGDGIGYGCDFCYGCGAGDGYGDVYGGGTGSSYLAEHYPFTGSIDYLLWLDL